MIKVLELIICQDTSLDAVERDNAPTKAGQIFLFFFKN